MFHFAQQMQKEKFIHWREIVEVTNWNHSLFSNVRYSLIVLRQFKYVLVFAHQLLKHVKAVFHICKYHPINEYGDFIAFLLNY